METPPPSYEEALDIDSGRMSSKFQQPPQEIPLTTLHGNPSELVDSATPPHRTAVQPTAPPYNTAVQPTIPQYPNTVQPTAPPYSTLTAPQYPSAGVHEVALAQPSGTDLSRELNYIL